MVPPKKRAARKPRRSRLPEQCLAGLMGACEVVVERDGERYVARLCSGNGQELASGLGVGPREAFCSLARDIATMWEATK
jgi:hypothetical protein